MSSSPSTRRARRVKTICSVCLATAFTPLVDADATTYDFMGFSNNGDDIVITGTFAGSDVDNDGTLEHPNGLLEVSQFNANATFFGGTKVTFPFGLSNLDPFAFTPEGNTGLASFEAAEDESELHNGNEVHNKSTLVVVNGGNPSSHLFSADLELRVATQTYHGIGNGPVLFTEKVSGGGGLGFQYGLTFGASGGSPLDGGTLLGAFSIDGIDDFSDLQNTRAPITSSEAVFFNRAGDAERWPFDSGVFIPPTPGSPASQVEVHYQCGSPDIYCWGSVDDFIDVLRGIQQGDPTDILRQLRFATMDAAGGMQNIPVQSAFLVSTTPMPGGPLGDYNGDGAIGPADFTVWRDELGQRGTALLADGNGDGIVAAADYAIWRGAYESALSHPASSSAAIFASQTVPEPAALYLAAVGLATLWRRQTRKR